MGAVLRFPPAGQTDLPVRTGRVPGHRRAGDEGAARRRPAIAAPGPSPPPLAVKGTLTPAGSETELRIAWADIAKLTGAKPADFNFGVVLNSSDDGKQLARRTFRFANDASYRLANCWAGMVVAP